MMFANMPSMLPQVRGGKLKGLAVTSAERSKAAPEVPTIAETLPGYVATSWYGIGAPAGTPEPILAKLEAAIGAALATPDIQKRWQDDLGLDMPPAGRAGFAEFLAADRARWTPAVKASGVRLD
jgi:tripartite-type tricarboxylate transporter receptor subunit TctC